MIKHIALICILSLTMPCIAMQTDQWDQWMDDETVKALINPPVGPGKEWDDMLIRLRERIRLDLDDCTTFVVKVRDEIGQEQLNAMDHQLQELVDSVSNNSNLKGLFDLFLQEYEILASYYVLETLPPKIHPMFSIERRLQAICTIGLIYITLESQQMMIEREIFAYKEMQFDIEAALRNLNTTHMIIPDWSDLNLDIIE